MWCLRVVCAVLAVTPVAMADELSRGVEFFEKRVRPVLVEHCYRCHSAEAEKIKGQLRVDGREMLLKGGEIGPAIVLGVPEKSRLIEAVEYRNEDLEMPPKGKLSDRQIEDLRAWVKMGAPWPEEKARVADSTEPHVDYARLKREHWAYQPVVKPAAPAVSDRSWARGDIDRFVLARLEKEELTPAADGDRRTLLRRLYMDLLGLPPTAQEIEAFLADKSDDVVAKVVDRLLASVHFGERWGRHWLDVARFAESAGGGRSVIFVNAWRYRDYVIASYNADKPFERFVREQVAGDLISADKAEEKADSLTATGFLALGAKNLDTQDKDLLRMDVVDEQIDTVGKAFLGLALGCARCHDHKFDPIPTADYYALAGIFRSTRTLLPGNVSGFVQRSLPTEDAFAKQREEHAAAMAELEERVRIAKLNSAAGKKGKGEVEPVSAEELKAMQSKLAELKKTPPPAGPMCVGVQDEKQCEDYAICVRGNNHNLGEKVPRGFLSIGPKFEGTISAGESGRRELADWLVDRRNPLTARVYVNRVWHHLFGAGIVRTVDDFGVTGEAPSHPHLLDYLASTFIEDGGSTKRLIRQIVLSRTYQMSSAASEGARAKDPENRLLSHQNRKRLEAEVIRDAMLRVSGQLDLTVGGPTIKAGASEYTFKFEGNRRSVYVPVLRYAGYDVLEAFDFPDPNLVVGRRTTSTLATQALMLMNSPFAMESARAMAGRMMDVEESARVDRAFEMALGRRPADVERSAVMGYLAEERDARRAWERVCQVLFASVDFRYVE